MIVPADGAGSSTSILSVEISAIAWPSVTASPAATCHSTSVPSLTDSPAVGVTMSIVSPVAGSRRLGGDLRSGDVGGRRFRDRGAVARGGHGGGLRLDGAVALGDRGRAVAGRDLGEDGAHLHGVALGNVDLGDRPAGGGRDLGVDLVGRDVHEDLVRLDAIALLLAPLEDGPLGHRLTHLREGDLHCRVDRHICSD